MVVKYLHAGPLQTSRMSAMIEMRVNSHQMCLFPFPINENMHPPLESCKKKNRLRYEEGTLNHPNKKKKIAQTPLQLHVTTFLYAILLHLVFKVVPEVSLKG